MKPSMKLSTTITLAAVLLTTGPAAVAQEQTYTLFCGQLIDVTKGRLLKNRLIEVTGNRIGSIRRAATAPATGQGTVIDLGDATCMPGLMDMHTHIITEQNPDRYVNQFRLDPADYAYQSVKFAERTLLAGFTTIRNLGSSNNLGLAIRDAIARGDIKGPRVIAAGKALATTGGHADPSNGRNAALTDDPGPKQGVVNGVEDARKAVRARYKDGSDVIKITATGGVLSQASSGQNAQFTMDELQAIIETAHDYGFKVAAHAHGSEGMKRAVLADIDSIEHGTYMTDEIMQLMKSHGTYYVPTIIAGKFVAEKAEIDGYFSDIVRPKARAIGPLIQETFARAWRAGVPIAFGTDSGVSPHGDNWKEFVYMVEAGMPPMAAIQSATVAASDLAGMQDRLGAVETGKLADIVAVRGDPIEDIERMGDMVFVMKDGQVYKSP